MSEGELFSMKFELRLAVVYSVNRNPYWIGQMYLIKIQICVKA
jgi:hypothetical protein